MTTVFIDGGAGTTGLRLADRLSTRADLQVVQLDEHARKDPSARKAALNDCDVALLCLPDQAAREAVSWVENPEVVVIDASTAHRTHPDWCYGFPELTAGQAEKIAASKRIAVPGCHASGFIALVQPLLLAGLLARDIRLQCQSLTGYSGGGKAMIAGYETKGRPAELDAPRLYGLNQSHKHLPEMLGATGLLHPPVFSPIVADYYSGMLVMVPLAATDLAAGTSLQDVLNCYRDAYRGPVVQALESFDQSGFIAANTWQGKDSMFVTVSGTDERMILLAGYDNLGKGASGAAVQCLNLVLGVEQTTGLEM